MLERAYRLIDKAELKTTEAERVLVGFMSAFAVLWWTRDVKSALHI